MVISKNAWHYRYMGFMGFSKPARLCPYFWKLVFCLMVPLVFTVLILGILGGVGFILFHIVPPIAAWFAHNWTSVAVGVGMVALLGGGAYVVMVLMSWLFSENTAQFRASVVHSEAVRVTGKGASLTGAYIVAWHHKVCPFLTFSE